uniref:Ovule protein n=1 Tax=Gongylonema pulchrum TaxID=637853 RepID=A0A183F0C7_9BILA
LDCQWKPPRFLKPPSDVAAALNGLNSHHHHRHKPIYAGNEPLSSDAISASCSESFSTISAVCFVSTLF